MKTNEAFEYVVRVAKSWGYTDLMIKDFAYEIHERLNSMEDTSKESVDEMMEDLF